MLVFILMIILQISNVKGACMITPDVNGQVEINENIPKRAFMGCKTLKYVKMGSAVTSIGKYAFYGCSSIENLTLPSTLQFVGALAFAECKSMMRLSIHSYNLSLDTIPGYSVFKGTTPKELYINMKEVEEDANKLLLGFLRIYFPGYSSGTMLLQKVTIGESVRKIGSHAFAGANNLESVLLPNTLESIGKFAFFGCSSLQVIDLPESISSIEDKAFGRTGLISFSIPDTLYSLGRGALGNCTSLESVVLSQRITEIADSTFYGCKSLKSLSIPESVTQIGKYAFSKCISLESITIPESVTQIGKCAFAECKSMMRLSIHSYNLSLDTIPGYSVFKGTTPKELYINMKEVEEDANKLLLGFLRIYFPGYSSGTMLLQKVTIGESVRKIGSHAFAGANNLESVLLPNTLESIGKFAFFGCSSLQVIDLPESISSIEDKAFGRTGLISFSIPDTLYSLGRGALGNCTSLESVVLSQRITEIADSTFYGCKSLKSLSIPESVTQIGKYAFSKCISLESIIIPNSVTSIGSGAFKDCSSLLSVTLSRSIIFIHADLFSNCESLESIDIPESVTSIRARAFMGCSSLSSVEIKEAVRQVGSLAFYQCSSLRRVYLNTPNSFYSSSAFDFITPSFNSSSFYVSKSIFRAEGLSQSIVRLKCFNHSSTNCVCDAGYGDGITQRDSKYFTCEPCAKGKSSSTPLSQNACETCQSGRYASNTASQTCTRCPSGRYSNISGSTSASKCEPCPKGRYVSTEGASSCLECPPGNSCGYKNMSIYDKCPVGTYQDRPGGINCKNCPEGQFQDGRGYAVCKRCPIGTASDIEKANSSSLCMNCTAGKYGNSDGLATCLPCPEGQYQPEAGKTECIVCSTTNQYLTNNEARTGCEYNKAFYSKSVVSLMLESGVGLGISFAVAALFAALAFYINRLKLHETISKSKEGEEDMQSVVTGGDLAVMEWPKVLIKSSLPGFSFSSEVVLVMGIMTENMGIGITILIFRLLHPITVLIFYIVWFQPDRVPEYLRNACQGQSLNRNFILKHAPVMGALLVVSLCDVTMVQMMPWPKCDFFIESHGYPSSRVMTVCLVTKSVHGMVTVICQISYMVSTSNLDNPTTSTDAKVLFGLSIALSVVQVIMGLMIWFVKGSLLNKSNNGEGQGEGGGMDPSTSGTKRRESSGVDLGEIYGDSAMVSYNESLVANPLHHELVETLKKDNEVQKEFIRAKDEEIRLKDEQLYAKDEEIRQLKQHLGGEGEAKSDV